MSNHQKYAMINASAGWNHASFPVAAVFATHDQFVAIGWIDWVAADPGQISWLVQGYYTVGRDMVKGY